jgi:cholest-4-en-3-one 26-monooxygenase
MSWPLPSRSYPRKRMRAEAMSPAEIDLTDVDMFLHGDPHATWRTLRREAPVHWQERSVGAGFWNITKYDDVIKVSVDPASFISGNGIILDNDGRQREREQMMAERGGAGYMDARGHMMIMTDPPRHTLMRQIVNKGFTHKAVLSLEPLITSIVTKIIDDVCEQGECDFVLDISKKLPLEVICELVGVPEGDWESMFELSNRVVGFDDPEYAVEFTPEDQQLSMDLFTYFMGLIAERRADPKDDVLTALIRAEVDGQSLQDHELFLFFILLIVAGNETTRNATTGGMLALMQNPAEAEKLRTDPGVTLTAVEEVVRWTSPVTHFTRTATRDVEIRDQLVQEGQEVCLWYPSANRDEDVFEDGDSFRVDRHPNPQIAFGKGEHFCLGANLARLELKVILTELVKRLPDMEPNGPLDRLRSNFIGGIKRMPVRFTPTATSA